MKEGFFKKNYAWVICIACTLAIFCTAGFCNNMLSVYLPFIQAKDLTSSQGSLIFTIRSSSSLIAMLLINNYYKKFSLKTGLTIGLGFSILSAFLYSIGGSVFMYYIAAVFSGFGFSLAGFVPVTLLIENWFHSKKGLALGISALGSGLATIFFPKSVTRIAENSGLRAAFLYQVVILLVCSILIFLLIKSVPDEKNFFAFDKQSRASKQDKTSIGYNTLQKPDWILIILLNLFYGGAIGTAIGHISILFTSSEYAAETAALMVSLFGICQAVGKLIFGFLCDKVGTKLATCVDMVLSGAGCLCAAMLNGTDILPCVLVAVLFGLGFAPAMSGISLWSNDISAGPKFTSTMKWWQVLYSLGCIVSSSFPGRIYAKTGEYKSSFILMGIMIFLGMICLIFIYSINTKRRNEDNKITAGKNEDDQMSAGKNQDDQINA